MTLDLDKLEALVKAMTPGPWAIHSNAYAPPNLQEFQIDAPSAHAILYAESPLADNHANTAGIVALVNAAPELIRMARDADAGWTEVASLGDQLRAALAVISLQLGSQGAARSVPILPTNEAAEAMVAEIMRESQPVAIKRTPLAPAEPSEQAVERVAEVPRLRAALSDACDLIAAIIYGEGGSISANAPKMDEWREMAAEFEDFR